MLKTERSEYFRSDIENINQSQRKEHSADNAHASEKCPESNISGNDDPSRCRSDSLLLYGFDDIWNSVLIHTGNENIRGIIFMAPCSIARHRWG